MSSWTADELDRIGRADELRLASRRTDGSLTKPVTMWVVRDADELYVRSAHGHDNPWFQRALRAGQGRVAAGGVERDVTFEVPDGDIAESVTSAYHAKYDRYGPRTVGTVVSAAAVVSTLRLVPR